VKNILFFLFLVNISVWSADLNLFKEDGSFNDYFSTSILSGDLQEGEKIHLYDRDVVFRNILGSGNTTLILKVYDPTRSKELALRLPHGNENKGFRLQDGQRFIDFTYNGYKDLKEAYLPIPKIHSYYKSSYLLVDIVEHDFDMKTFLARNEFYSEQQRNKILKSLLSFARDTAIYQYIGDFHLEQIVYSEIQDKWFLLDWTDNYELARLPSSPTLFKSHQFSNNNIALDENGNDLFEILDNGQKIKVHRDITDFERRVLHVLDKEIEAERKLQADIDKIELNNIKTKLNSLSDHSDIIEVYKEIRTVHLASFYTMLQKDFIDNHLSKFPENTIKKAELKILLENLGKFTPYYFSQFAEKIISNISDFDTFMYLYNRLNDIGLDEDLEEDMAAAITKNIERILSNTTTSPERLETIETLKNRYGIISYQTREILERAHELLRPSESCSEVITSFFARAN